MPVKLDFLYSVDCSLRVVKTHKLACDDRLACHGMQGCSSLVNGPSKVHSEPVVTCLSPVL